MKHTPLTHLAGVVAAGGLALGLAACDSNADAAPRDRDTASCDVAATVLAAPLPNVGPDTPPEQAGPLFQAYAQALVDPATQLVQLAPSALTDEASTLQQAIAGVAEAGDPTFLFDPATDAARSTLSTGEGQTCGWRDVHATGIDYRFGGIPEQVPAGVTVFEFTNRSQGEEPHELLLFRRLDDVSVDELLAMAPDEAAAHVEKVQSVFVPAPGLSAATVADLEPGSYVALCFVPVGTHGMEPGDGPPHAMAGMVTAFTVR